MAETSGTAGPTSRVARERSRPLGVVLLVLFQIVNAMASLAGLAGYLGPRSGSLLATIGAEVAVLDYLMVGLAILSVAAAVGLWRLARFGWYAVMLLTGFGLILQLAFYVWATPNFLNLGIYVVSAFYLNQREVKGIFLAPPADPDLIALAEEGGGPP